MNKRNIFLATLVCLVFIFPSFVSAQALKPIRIGVVAVFSGPMAIHNQDILAAHKIATAEIMKAGGFQKRPVEFVIRDDGANPEQNGRYLRELITKGEVDWIFDGFSSACAVSAAAVAKEFKFPIFIWGTTGKVRIEDWNPYIFPILIPPYVEARGCAKILAEEMLKGIKSPKVYWISWDYEYGHDSHGPFMETIKKLIPDVQIVGEAWPRAGELDYGPFITHMMAVKPHAIMSTMWAGGAISLLKQGKAMGLWDISKLINMSQLAGTEYRLQLGKDIPEGTWSNAYEDPSWPDNEKHRKFYQAYYNFTGKNEPPRSLTAIGYYLPYLLDAAMRKAGTTDQQAVMKALEGTSIDSFWGPLAFRDFDHQLTLGLLWGPMKAKEGLPYLVFDTSRVKYVPGIDDFLTKEEWLAKRKAAGK